jgi:hypothetical protein
VLFCFQEVAGEKRLTAPARLLFYNSSIVIVVTGKGLGGDVLSFDFYIFAGEIILTTPVNVLYQ